MSIAIYIAFYLICALNIIWGIGKKKSNLLYAVSFIAIFFLMTFNYDGPDIGVYRTVYAAVGEAASLGDALNSSYMERGYAFLMFCGNKIGLDFFSFRVVLTIICLALFASTIKFYKVNPNFIVGLYMVYLFFFDTVQLRNCVAQFIVLFATRFLVTDTKGATLKYILCLLVASGIHILSLIYLSLLIVKIFKRRKTYKNIFALATILFVLFVLISPALPQIMRAVSKLLQRGSSYLVAGLRFNQFVVMGLHLLGLLPLYFYGKTVCDENNRRILDTIMKIEIIMGLFLPLCFINSNFNRIYRNILILDTIGLAVLYANTARHSKPHNFALVAQFLLTFGWLATDLYRNRNENIIGSIFEYNSIFDNFAISSAAKYTLVGLVCIMTVLLIKRLFSYRNDRYRAAVKCS